MTKTQENKKRILNYLKSKEWETSSTVSKKLKINFYKAEILLTELFYEGIVEKDMKKHQTFWRLKEDV